MTYLMIYLALGAVTFLPMLYADEECRDHVMSGSRLMIVLAWVIWSFVWAFSLTLDGIFWIMEKAE